MSTRREWIQIGALAAAAPLAPCQQHEHGAETKPSPRTARYFRPAEITLLEQVVERILPKTDTPGAAEAGVAYFIDWQAHTDRRRGAALRRDLNWVRRKGFGGKDVSGQVALLTAWSQGAGEPLRIFQLFKGLTIDGYYGTREGLQTELGWNANTFLREFPGCTHPEHA